MSDTRPTAPPICPPAPPATRRERTDRRPASLRFSLQFLLIVVTIVALASPLLPWLASPMAAVLLPWLLSVAAPICLLTGAIYARGSAQTFFLGASGAALMAVFSRRAFTLAPGFESLLWAGMLLATYGVCGCLALATRWYVERRGWHVPPESQKSKQEF